MVFKHYFSSKMNYEDRATLLNLIYDCDFIHDKKIDHVVNDRDYKSVICTYDGYGDICGFASVEDYDNYLFLSELYVSPSARGKGYGTGLLDKVKNFAKKENYNFVELNVTLENVHAQRLYQRKRFLFTTYRKNDGIATMKLFSSTAIYHRAAVLFEIAKRNGSDKLIQGLHEAKNSGDYTMFYPYFRGENKDNLIEKVLNSEILQKTAMFITETLIDNSDEKDCRFMINRLTYQADLSSLPSKYDGSFAFTRTISREDMKEVGLSAEAFLDLKENEILIQEINKDRNIEEKKRN